MPEAVKKTAEDIIQAARARLEALFLSVGMPESHGVSHCLTVLGHMDSALASTALAPEVRDLLTPRRQLSLRLASLLHEADDHKYFKTDSKNATNIMREVLSTESESSEVIREVEEMISEADQDGDELIDLGEFQELMRAEVRAPIVAAASQ